MLGIPNKPKNAKVQSPLGVKQDPNATPANLMGQKSTPKPSGPEFQGPPPPLPPPIAPITNAAGSIASIAGQVGAGSSPAPTGGQPIAWNGGYIDPSEAPFGFDLMAPGVNDQFWMNNQDKWFTSPQMDWVDSLLPQFQDPWKGEQTVSGIVDNIAKPGAGQDFWAGVQGSFNTMGAGLDKGYTGPNNSQLAFDMTKDMLPGSMQPQFDAYYDRMKQKAMSDVNSQSAARGAYGSNAALNNSIGAGIDVEAQRAKAATDFMLADSANQMNWQGLLGNQGRAADLTGLAGFDSRLRGAQFGLDKTRLGGELAFKAEGMDFDKNKTQAELAFGLDDQKLERLGAGISTAINSHQARRGQLNDAFDASNIVQQNRDNDVKYLSQEVEQFTNDVQGYVMQNLDKLLGMDQQAMEAELEAMLAKTADERGWDQYTTERARRDVMDAVEAVGKLKEAKIF